jgi:hypothetical protein
VMLVLLAHTALSNNFRFGQYYILLLCLLAAALWCLLRDHEYTGGALIGLIFVLKLYSAPFALYFAVRRQWKALAGFAVAVAVGGLVAVMLFGWNDVWFFINTVLARGTDGSVNEFYNPGTASMTGFLRRTLIAEPELNPDPLWNAPAAFFFLRACYTLSVLGTALLALAKAGRDREAQAIAWFVIVLFALAPNQASYHFVMMVAPVALLLAGASRRWSAGLIAGYIALELPLFSWDARLYPRAWLLLALFLYTGWAFLRRLSVRELSFAGIAIVALSAVSTFQRMRTFGTETPQTSRPAIVVPAAIYSSAPASGPSGWIYEAIGSERYVLKKWTNAGIRTFSFDGDAFHPSQSRTGHMVAFELAARGHSQISLLDPDNGKLDLAIGPELNPTEPVLSPDGTMLAFISGGSLYLAAAGTYRSLTTGEISNPAFFPDGRRIVFAKGRPGSRSLESVEISGAGRRTTADLGDCFTPAVSPDGRMLAFACSATGSRHIWLQDLAARHSIQLTHGFCNNDSPAWDSDSRSIVFASDCNRGLGLTTLYRLNVSGMTDVVSTK